MISSKTSFIALIGNPVSHSLSPIMQNAAFQYLGLDLIYIAIPCKDEDLELVLNSLKKINCKGLNITIPHKERVFNLCSEISPIASKLKAINTLKLNSEKEQGAIYHEKFESLLSVSDVLSVCCPASKETINLINKDSLELLPKGAVVTNVARGDIVDDEALIDALNRRKVYAVGLDVYKNEPNLNPGYLKHKSAFILPHLGSATKETRTAMANLAIDNLTEFFQSGSCKNKVN